MAYSDYTAVQVTLADADTPYNVYALVLEATGSDDVTASPVARELNFQHDPESDGGSILVGDGNIAADRYGYVLLAGDSRTYRSFAGNVPVPALWVMCTEAGALLNVEILVF